MSVEEAPFAHGEDGGFHREFTLHLQFHDLRSYPDRLHLSWAEIAATVGEDYAKAVEKAVIKRFRRSAFLPEIESVAVNEAGGAATARKGDATGGAADDAQAEDVGNPVNADGADGEEDEDENREVRFSAWCTCVKRCASCQIRCRSSRTGQILPWRTLWHGAA